NFTNVQSTMRRKLPFGIAQMGKSFRNEITPRNFIFRTREFEQMEIEYFCKPGHLCKDGEWTGEQWHEHWMEQRMNWYVRYGIRRENLRIRMQDEDELAHYAKDAFDIEFYFPMGWQELEGIHSRTDFDLGRHAEYSKKDLTYLDDQTRERYVPYVIETSAGLTRSVLMVLSDAYEEQQLEGGDTRTVMHFHPLVAPVTVAVLPLVKKDGIADLAKRIEQELREDFSTFYDQSGAIGRRYRRQDEIGTPFCITVDYDTKEDNTVTIRYRDSMEQERLPVAEIAQKIREEIKNYRRD
ncbi:MAG: glycine--tRNA ligase, partial [Spirochaetota bacterium]